MTATTLLSDNGVSSGVSGYQLTGGNDGTLQLQTATSGGTATTAVTIDNSQNVGIGTSSPAVPLHVASTGAYQARFERTSSANSYITFKGTSTVGNNGIGTSGDNVSLITGGTERAVIDSSGNVGIGTSSPRCRLSVNSSDFTTGMPNKIRLYDDGGNVIFGFGVSVGLMNYNSGDGGHAFYTGGGTPVERMRIDSSGNLLVGTTSSTNAGRITAASDPTTSSYPVYVNNTNTGSASLIVIDIARNGNRVGSISNTNTATAYNTSSDYRLKHDIQPMTDALAKVQQLKPVTYKWNADDSDGEGFIAHELQEVCPDAVTGEKDAVDADGNSIYQGIDTSFLVATLTAAIQEQQAIIQQLTARIETLEAK